MAQQSTAHSALERTQDQFPTPITNSSQPSLTPDPRDPMPLASTNTGAGISTHMHTLYTLFTLYIYRLTHRHMIFKRKFLNE